MNDESVPKRKEAERFEFEPRPQASQFGSWKILFRREVISGSTNPRLISEWFGEVDIAAGMGDLDYSWFVFDKKSIHCDTLDSEIAKRIMKIIPAVFRKDNQFLGGDVGQEQTSRGCRQADYVPDFLVLQYEQDSRTNNELECLAQRRIVQRRSQSIQPSLGRDSIGSW